MAIYNNAVPKSKERLSVRKTHEGHEAEKLLIVYILIERLPCPTPSQSSIIAYSGIPISRPRQRFNREQTHPLALHFAECAIIARAVDRTPRFMLLRRKIKVRKEDRVVLAHLQPECHPIRSGDEM